MNRTSYTTREVILLKSSILFWEKGYAETSMKDIASSCGFRPANIYNYFCNKETILFEILKDEMEAILKPIRKLKGDASINPPDALRKIIENHVRLTLGVRRSSMLLFDVGLGYLSKKNKKKIIQLRDEYDEICREILTRGIQMGFFRKIDVKLVAFSVASIIARSRMWFSPNGKYSVDEYIDFIYDFITRGIISMRR
ncbi:MAG: TetR/AcrR family transcriptional regulator [Spirochaetes bacterium]|nr:TetR/AcrR family transcriptional regulator [Spirochaetota bacterium]